jgi:hypothetical protein
MVNLLGGGGGSTSGGSTPPQPSPDEEDSKEDAGKEEDKDEESEGVPLPVSGSKLLPLQQTKINAATAHKNAQTLFWVDTVMLPPRGKRGLYI